MSVKISRHSKQLATYSPEILSRITIPEHLRPARLMAHAGSGFDNIRSSSSCPRRTEFTSLPNSIRPPSRSLGDPTTLSQTTYPSSGLPSTHASSRPARNVTPLSPTFSFFDDISSYHRGSFLSSATAHEQTETYGLMQDDPRSNQILGAQFKYQTLTMPGTAHERTYSTVSSVSTHAVRFDFLRSTAGLSHDQRATTEDQRQHLLRALYEQPHSQGSVSGPEYCPSPNYNIRAKEPRWAECQSPLATLNRLGTSAQTNTPQPPQSHHSANYDATSTNAHSSPSHRLRPIPRPTPNIPSNHTTAALAPSSTPRTASTRGGASSQTANIDERLPQEVQVQLNGIAQPSHKLLFSHQLRMQSDSSPSPPTQYPGIIGSGRPSASVPKSSISAENEAAGSRWSHIVGNGRLIFPATVIHDAPEKVQPHATTENEDMIPFSALPLRNSGEETKNKRDFGAIGQPKTEQTNGNDQSTGEPADLLEQLTKLSVGGIVEPQMPAGRTNMASFRLATRSSDSTWPRPQDTDDITTTPSPHCASRSQLFLQPSSQNPLTSNSPLAVGSDLKNDATLVSSHHTFSILPSSLSSTAGYKQLKARPNDSSPFIPAGSTEYERPLEDQINEKKQDALCRAVVLLLNARERVLTLSEQRVSLFWFIICFRPFSHPSDTTASPTDVSRASLTLAARGSSIPCCEESRCRHKTSCSSSQQKRRRCGKH
ncbi:hypothetical protein K439DRAFT_318079 [Ramaria rubella]|nr:hypothetical protein K439DRAFT_318079 [Ramaria rubella]